MTKDIRMSNKPDPDSFGVSTKYSRPGQTRRGLLLTPHLRQNKRAEVNNGDRILYQATIRC